MGYGTYTYNEETGELISNCISNSLDLAMGTMTEKDAWYLTDINTLEHHTLEFNGNVGGDVVSYYTRLSCKIGQKRINGVTKV
ncbi:hypothetical protein [Butyrivibrio sp. XPD2006]|uniref:hypothetical protein n=1 Tax=Butyrivibrio sp. XPD2006 TaxID=1280668 RepID=UPI0003B49EED|nr:hypothetical protein [Butyrivibrio sp. XPD2006]